VLKLENRQMVTTKQLKSVCYLGIFVLYAGLIVIQNKIEIRIAKGYCNNAKKSVFLLKHYQMLEISELFDSSYGIGFIVGMLVVLIMVLVVVIFYLLTLQRTFDAISPENRLMPSGQVWLLLIPVFNWVWQFIVVSKLSDSIRLECARLNIATSEERPTYNIGLAKNILSFGGLIPVVGNYLSIVSTVCWIIYWTKVSAYKKLILSNQNNFLLDVEQASTTESDVK
jgi:hypothetical protein